MKVLNSMQVKWPEAQARIPVRGDAVGTALHRSPVAWLGSRAGKDQLLQCATLLPRICLAGAHS